MELTNTLHAVRLFFRRYRSIPFTLFVSAFALAPAHHANAAAFDAELAFTRDSNVSRGQYRADVQDDEFVSGGMGLSFLQSLSLRHRIVYRLFARGEDYQKYDKLSHILLGAQGTYQYRSSGAFTASTFGIFIRGGIDEYNSRLRDADVASAGISWRKPLTDRIVTTAIVSGNWRDSDSTVFDMMETSLLLNADYAWGADTTLYLTYNRLEGDIVSTSISTTSPRLAFVNNAEAINADDAFPAGAIVYRLDGTTNVITLGLNYKLSEQHSLDFSGRYADARAKGGINYDRYQISVAYLIRM